MNHSPEEIQKVLSIFRTPDRASYPELQGYSRDEIYEDFSGGGGLYLATHMVRTLHLKPDDLVLDLGCGSGVTSIFLAKHFHVKVIALDLWTSANFLKQKFIEHNLADRIIAIQMDATKPLPFPVDHFDAIFCMNSFNFYGGSIDFIRRLLTYLKLEGQICIGSEVLTSEFTVEQRGNRLMSTPFSCLRQMNISMSSRVISSNNTPPGGGANFSNLPAWYK